MLLVESGASPAGFILRSPVTDAVMGQEPATAIAAADTRVYTTVLVVALYTVARYETDYRKIPRLTAKKDCVSHHRRRSGGSNLQ